MTRRTTGASFAALLLATGTILSAQAPIKIGTIAPEQSVWAKTMKEMGEAWKARSAGRVTYILFPATVGSEDQILRDMRISRKLQAAQLSAITLGSIDQAFNVFALPMFFENFEEVDAVLTRVGPTLEQRLEAKGLKVLNWGYVGWVHLFTTKPVKTLDDIKKLKLYTSAGDDVFPKWYRENGFNPVPLDPSQMSSALSTRMIEAVPLTPYSAQVFTWYKSASYMTDIGFAPLLGATVITLDAWKKIAPDDQRVIQEEALKAGAKLRTEIPRLDRQAIEAMKKGGLTVSAVDSSEWRKTGEKFGDAMRAQFPKDALDLYDAARRERDAVRARRAR